MTGAVIETARLLLEPVTPLLARAVVEGRPTGLPHGAGWPTPDTPAALSMEVDQEPGAPPGAWLVVWRETGEVIGDLGWKGGPDDEGCAEIGYGLGAPWRGRGIGTEAVGALVRWALAQPGCSSLTAEVLEDNAASRRLLERLGFALDRRVPPHVWYVLDGPST